MHMQARTLYMPSHCRMVCSSSAALEIVCTLQPHRERTAGQSSNPKRVLQRPLLTSPCHFLFLALKAEAITRQVFSPHLDHGDELFPGGPEKAKALRKVRKRKDKRLTVIVRSPLQVLHVRGRHLPQSIHYAFFLLPPSLSSLLTPIQDLLQIHVVGASRVARSIVVRFSRERRP